jgi:hypothetical protein
VVTTSPQQQQESLWQCDIKGSGAVSFQTGSSGPALQIHFTERMRTCR